MRLDLTRIHFGKYMSRHMIYDENGASVPENERGLYLALASGSSSLFGGSSVRAKGFLKITPLFDGNPAEFEYSASPSVVEIKAQGGSIRFAIDGEKALRIEGSGLSLLLEGKLSFGENANQHDLGAEIAIGGTRYVITALKGSVALDTHWDLRALRGTDPKITVAPDADGTFSAVAYDTDTSYTFPELSPSFDACAADSQNEFQEFFNNLTCPEFSADDLGEFACYALWTGFQPCLGAPAACSDKMGSLNFSAMEQPLISLPFKNIETAIDIISAGLSLADESGLVPATVSAGTKLYEAATPVYGWALERIISGGELSTVPREKLGLLYERVSKAFTWWLNNRQAENGLLYYAFPHECGMTGEDIFASAAPVASPDLAAYAVLCSDCLCKIAVLLYKADEAAKWTALKKKQLALLNDVMWDGKQFNFINVLTGLPIESESLLRIVPVILGGALGEDITRELGRAAACGVDRGCDRLLACIIANGLLDCGLGATAEQIAMDMFASCLNGGICRYPDASPAPGGFFTPAACASLLYLCSRIMY